MKKYLIVILTAIIIGSTFAYYVFSVNKNESVMALKEVNKKVYVFQLGVFSSKENANNKINVVNPSTIKQINEYYYVYGAVYSDIYLVSLFKKYYEEYNI